MDRHEIDHATYVLTAISAAFSIVWVIGVVLQLHAEGSEFLSWNSWLNYLSSASG